MTLARVRDDVASVDLSDADCFAPMLNIAAQYLGMSAADIASSARVSKLAAHRWMGGIAVPPSLVREAVRRALLLRIDATLAAREQRDFQRMREAVAGMRKPALNKTTERAKTMTTSKPKRALLTIEQAATVPPECTPSTVRTWIATGQLPSVKAGRRRYVRRSDLASFLGITVDEIVVDGD